jgi:hypothetical protein
LRQYQNEPDDAATEQASPEQDGPGVEREQPRKKRRGAPGDGGNDNERNAQTMLGRSPRHKAIQLVKPLPPVAGGDPKKSNSN